MIAASSEEIFGHAVDRWPVAEFGGSGALGREQRAVARLGLVPLVGRRGSRVDVWTIVWSSPHGHSFVAMIQNQQGGWQFFPTVAIYRAGNWARLPVPLRTVSIAW